MKRKLGNAFLLVSFELCVLGFAYPLHAAGVVTEPLSSVKVYPNPWRADLHTNALIKFENLQAASTVKIFTVSGHEVKRLSADSNGSADWDRTNDSGDKVASGVYLFLANDLQGNETKGKLAIIK